MKGRQVWCVIAGLMLVQVAVLQAAMAEEPAGSSAVHDQEAAHAGTTLREAAPHSLQETRLRGLIGMTSGSSSLRSISSEKTKKKKKKKGSDHHWYDDIQIHGIPPLVTHLGLHLKDPAAERAFFAKDYAAVSYSDFRALWGRCEQAKRDEEKLIRDHASDHTILCNKVLKVGAEAVMFSIFGDSASAHEHLLKFRKNIPLVGHTCKDAGLG